MTNHVRELIAADVPHLLPLVVEAFAPQPLTVWLMGRGPDALRRATRLTAVDFRQALRYGLGFTNEERQGAALWYRPGQGPGFWQDVAYAFHIARSAGLSRRLISQFRALRIFARLRPREPHYYLALLGVGVAFQGRGVGSALLQPVLRQCDQEGRPAYLETDTEPNVRFYRRHGFAVRDTVPIPNADFTMWTLWREPQR